MSIADKLNTIAENEQKVYDAGKEAAHSEYINPEWTDWEYFDYLGCRDSLAQKLKYTDTSNGTNFVHMFDGCSLATIPEIDTSKGTNFGSMFQGCDALATIPEIDTSNGTSFSAMFRNCGVLTKIPEIDTSNGTKFSSMFDGCDALTTIPKLNVSKATQNYMPSFLENSELKNITFEGTIPYTINFQYSPLTLESAKSVINALVNYSGTNNANTYSVTFSETTWEYLDADSEIEVDGVTCTWRDYISSKGWTC